MEDAKSYIGKLMKIKIGRPISSKYPKYKYLYPLNYEFISNTVSVDGR